MFFDFPCSPNWQVLQSQRRRAVRTWSAHGLYSTILLWAIFRKKRRWAFRINGRFVIVCSCCGSGLTTVVRRLQLSFIWNGLIYGIRWIFIVCQTKLMQLSWVVIHRYQCKRDISNIGFLCLCGSALFLKGIVTRTSLNTSVYDLKSCPNQARWWPSMPSSFLCNRYTMLIDFSGVSIADSVSFRKKRSIVQMEPARSLGLLDLVWPGYLSCEEMDRSKVYHSSMIIFTLVRLLWTTWRSTLG